MFNKKIYMILLLFIVSICAISAVSASENITDTSAIDDVASDDVVNSVNEDLSIVKEDDASQDILASQEDDVLSGIAISGLNYKINLNDNGYKISGTKGGTITYYMEPCQTYAINAYNFYFKVSADDGNGNEIQVYKSNTISSSSDRKIGNHYFTFPAKKIAPGIYTLQAVNDGLDSRIMDTTTLNVTGTAVISAQDYTAVYNSGKETTVKVTDKDTGLPLKYFNINAVFSDGTESVSGRAVTDSAGQITYVPTFNAGTFTVTYSSFYPFITATAVKKNIVVTKAPVDVTAKKVSAYQGYKVTLKATVKSNGKNVNEGKVTFNINGKSYDVNVKNGVATKKLTFKKAKTYKYTAKFKSNNFMDSAAAAASANIKKRYATKLSVSNQKVYRGQNKVFYVTVKTTGGKLVKSGKVKIIDAVKVNKKGKAKFYTAMDLNYIKQIGNTVYFKKTVTKTYKVKYIPASKQYKASTKKVKITMKYKCTACGSTSSHSHPSMNMRFIVS